MNRNELISLINEGRLNVALDVGCGDYSFSLKYRDEKDFDLIVGIDIPGKDQIPIVEHIGGNKYYMDGDGEDLPFNDGVIDHIESKASFLVEWDDGTSMNRVLKDDGTVGFLTYTLNAVDVEQLRRLFGAKIEISHYFRVDVPNENDDEFQKAMKGDWNYDVRGFKNECTNGGPKRCYHSEREAIYGYYGDNDPCQICEVTDLKK